MSINSPLEVKGCPSTTPTGGPGVFCIVLQLSTGAAVTSFSRFESFFCSLGSHQDPVEIVPDFDGDGERPANFGA